MLNNNVIDAIREALENKAGLVVMFDESQGDERLIAERQCDIAESMISDSVGNSIVFGLLYSFDKEIGLHENDEVEDIEAMLCDKEDLELVKKTFRDPLVIEAIIEGGELNFRLQA